MINYSSIIQTLQSDKYIDKTQCFETVLWNRFLSFNNCRGTGSSLFLKTLACFLDETIDTQSVFCNLKISKSEYFPKACNTYRVVWLDFSDFHANSYEEAVKSLKQKTSDVYKHQYHYIELNNSRRHYTSSEHILDIIEGNASVDVLQESLKMLLLQLRGYVTDTYGCKLALLIDNMSRMETIAEEKGFSNEMRHFMGSFIVSDIYKYCDLFLQINDHYEENAPWSYYDRYMSDRGFTVNSFDIRTHHQEIMVQDSCQHSFEYQPYLPKSLDWAACITRERQKIWQARLEEQQRREEHIRWEKKRYAECLSPKVPPLSPNLGIRTKRLDKGTPAYAKANALLKDIYGHFSPHFHAYDIYKYFQKLNTAEAVVRNTETYKERLEGLTNGLPEWQQASTGGSSSQWIQAIFYRAEDKDRSLPACPENLKVYACMENKEAEDIFASSLRYLLKHARKTFAAKIATYRRSDQMCYWLSTEDFKHLEDFFQPYSDSMAASLPFVAYKGKLGISRDFPGIDDSHNATQAQIIADYLKTIDIADNIDLEDMYNNYIAKWNADIYEENDHTGFKRSSALAFVVIMDTLDAILGNTAINEDSLLLSGDKEVWRILAKSCCWADVNDKFDTAV